MPRIAPFLHLLFAAAPSLLYPQAAAVDLRARARARNNDRRTDHRPEGPPAVIGELDRALAGMGVTVNEFNLRYVFVLGYTP